MILKKKENYIYSPLITIVFTISPRYFKFCNSKQQKYTPFIYIYIYILKKDKLLSNVSIISQPSIRMTSLPPFQNSIGATAFYKKKKKKSPLGINFFNIDFLRNWAMFISFFFLLMFRSQNSKYFSKHFFFLFLP
jgi:hypothetical protein